MWENSQTAGPISTTFGTHIMQIYSSGNEHRLKNNYPLGTPGGILRGLCGQKLEPANVA